jgi:hypothetical protein
VGILVFSACGGKGSGGNGGTSASGGVTGGGKGGTSGTAGAMGGGAGTGGVSGAGGSAGGSSGGGAAGTGGGGTGGQGGAGGGGGTGAVSGGGGSAGASGSGGGAGNSGGAAGIAGRGGSSAAGTSGTAGASGAGGSGGTTGTAGTGGACTTSVSGTVYDPAGTLPLYNVSVYAPTTALTAITEGVTCDRCGLLSGAPAAVTTSDVQGKFKLEGIPAGVNVPLVFQIGKWRRQVTIPNVAACADTALTDANLTRLPRDSSEGHIPRIAITTGGADALECFVRRIGIADTEFTSDAGAGRVHLYEGGDGTNSFAAGGTFSAAATLWSSPTKLANYDMIGFSCEGSTSKFIDQKPQTSVDNIAAYANSGGRLLLGHYHFYWLQHSSDFSGTASYVGNLTSPATSASEPIDLTVNTTFSGGAALAQWLAGPIVAASPTPGRITVSGLEHSVTAVTAPTAEWTYLASNPQDSQHRRSVQFLSFQTPVGMPPGNQCGKAMLFDTHIKQSASTISGAGGDDSDPSKPFPSGCKTNVMTPQMKALEFVFFDLGACL